MCSRHTKQRQYAKECFVVAQRVFLLTGEVSPKRVFFFLNNDLRGFFVARNEGKKKIIIIIIIIKLIVAIASFINKS
jgi:hypothetical protein